MNARIQRHGQPGGRRRGCAWIDDVGTDHSSLACLGLLPIGSLMIDRSLVSGLHTKARNVEIVRAVLNFGLSLGRE